MVHPSTRRARKWRRWADIVVIFTAVYALMFAVYAPQLAEPAPYESRATAPGVWWGLYAVAGAVALIALLVAFRSRTVARVMVAVAGAILLSGIALFPGLTVTVMITLLLPGALLLLVSPFVGPLPTPEQEGRSRQ